MSNFKIGDDISFGNNYVYRIQYIRSTGRADVQLILDGKLTSIYNDQQLTTATLVKKNNNKTFMKTVTNMMKKLLDSDTQTLVKAGFINGDLELTEAGQTELITLLFVANKPALVTRASEVIAEIEKNNK